MARTVCFGACISREGQIATRRLHQRRAFRPDLHVGRVPHPVSRRRRDRGGGLTRDDHPDVRNKCRAMPDLRDCWNAGPSRPHQSMFSRDRRERGPAHGGINSSLNTAEMIVDPAEADQYSGCLDQSRPIHPLVVWAESMNAQRCGGQCEPPLRSDSTPATEVRRYTAATGGGHYTPSHLHACGDGRFFRRRRC
jgi:hypothetical protein